SVTGPPPETIVPESVSVPEEISTPPGPTCTSPVTLTVSLASPSTEKAAPVGSSTSPICNVSPGFSTAARGSMTQAPVRAARVICGPPDDCSMRLTGSGPSPSDQVWLPSARATSRVDVSSVSTTDCTPEKVTTVPSMVTDPLPADPIVTLTVCADP